MTTDDLSDVYDGTSAPESKQFVRECRGCEHTIDTEVIEPDPNGDRWVRCAECRTINRILPRHQHAEAEEA